MSKIELKAWGWIAIIVVLFSGCNYIAKKAGYEDKQAAEKRIEDVKKEKEAETAKKVEEVEIAKDALLNKVKDNFSKSTENVYGAKLASDMIPDKDRIHTVLDYKLSTALSYSPPMTMEAMLRQNELLKKELDESQTSLEQLKKDYGMKRDEANAAREAEGKAQLLIEQKKKELYEYQLQKDKEIQDLQSSLNEANNQIIAQSTERELEKKEESKRRMWLVSLFGFAALATGAGAIFSPIAKKEMAIGAAVCVGLSIGAAVVPVYIITIIFVVGVLIVAVPALIKAVKEYKVATQTYTAIETVKKKNPDVYESLIKPELIDSHGEYSKDGKVVPNKNTKDFIDQRLMNVNAK